MRVQTLSILAAATAVSAQSSTVVPAPVVTNNPLGVSYIGVLPAKAGSNVRGSLVGTSGTDGVGVKFQISVSGLPSTGGPFIYHLHEKPVPTDGNCTGTGAHIDPYKRGEVPLCDASKPETCQTGDESGKNGNITGLSWSQEYLDPYSSTNPSSNAFFGNLSWVLHLSNKTRIACANFTLQAPPVSNDTISPPSTGYNTSKPSPSASSPPAQFTGGAVKVAGGSMALLGAVAALVL